MSRPLKLLALSTVLALAAGAVPANAFAGSTADVAAKGGSSSEISGVPADGVAPAKPLGAGYPTAKSFAKTSTAWSVPIGQGATLIKPAATGDNAKAIKKHWPVRYRVGIATRHVAPQSGDPSQNIVSVKAVADRLKGVQLVDAVLGGTPTASTDSEFRVGFGTVSGGNCVSPAGAYIGVHSYGNGAAYQVGNRLRYQVALPAMRSNAWTCMLAGVISADGATAYDIVTNGVFELRQRPILRFAFKGKRLKPGQFTRVPIRILNSPETIATAPKVRLIIKTRGPVQVRWNPRVGKIAPGAGKKGAIFVKKSGFARGKVILILKSREYRYKISVPVTTRRR